MISSLASSFEPNAHHLPIQQQPQHQHHHQQNGSPPSSDASSTSPFATSMLLGENSRKRRHTSPKRSESSSGNEAIRQEEDEEQQQTTVEQQLAATSPNVLLFQQALLEQRRSSGGAEEDALLQSGNGTALNGEETVASVEQRQQMMAEFLEAQKAFHKLTNQLTGFGESRNASAAAVPLNPFKQLATLSPFLLALQHQSAQFQQFSAQPDPTGGASLLAPHADWLHAMGANESAAAEGLFGGLVSHQQQQQEEEEADDGDSEGTLHCGASQHGPEDLSVKAGRSDCETANGRSGGGSRNGSASTWPYEEQFKQLYELSADPRRKEMLNDWLQFMHRNGKPVARIPIMAKSVLDLYELYRLVVQHGGLVEVINKKLWREITKGLNLPNSITSAAFTLRTQYEKYLFDYECDRHAFSTPADLKTAIEANKREGRRPPPSSATTPSSSSTTTHNNNSTSAQGNHRPSTDQQQQQRNNDQAQQQQQQMAQIMAAFGGGPFGAAFGPPPPSVAAAFFGNRLNFGAPARDEDVQQQLNALSSSAQHAIQQFGLADLIAAQQAAGQPQFGDFFTKSEVPTTRPEMAQQSGNDGASEALVRTTSSAEIVPKRRRLSNSASGGEEENRENEERRVDSANSAAAHAYEVSAATTSATAGPTPLRAALKNAAQQCTLKMNESAGDASVAVSMELNGTLYRGLLYAVDKQHQAQVERHENAK